ncbi:MAG: ATP-binding protein [Bacteroidetes bacterium]|nr:ATP-binding protein [Bacteroidota bacterium]MBL7105085.1 ATP-binding protein [Bacteroidales bacterium]
MENLFKKHIEKVQITKTTFIRDLTNEIFWDERLIGIKGQRGTGKTTLLLQYIKQNFKPDGTNLYVSMDDLYFSENRLVDLVDDFVKNGGTYLFLDEVHRYKNWAQEIKNIYDDYPGLNIVFTGSSILHISTAKADLSRRAMIYQMTGLSFREYLNFILKLDFNTYSLSEILSDHVDIAMEITKKTKPIKYFKTYLESGYFPFFKEYPKTYLQRVEEIINLIIDIDLFVLKDFNQISIGKIKQLLYIIAQSSPFKPNIKKLSERIGINRNTLVTYLHYLNEAKIINSLFSDTFGIGALQKPDKIYLENPNFIYALENEKPNIGNIRETFFMNQLSYKHKVTHSKQTDFAVNNKYIFEVGGKYKTNRQIAGTDNSYIAADDIEYGFRNKIPLWLFGFLY